MKYAFYSAFRCGPASQVVIKEEPSAFRILQRWGELYRRCTAEKKETG